MKMIRWSGLGLFVVVSALLAVLIHFFVDGWIKSGIETVAGNAVGAEVNVGSVSHTYSPFGLTINQLQVTDPNNPSKNKVEVSSATATIDLLPMLIKKIIVDELELDGVTFDTQRSAPGKVYMAVESTETEASADAGFDLSVELPSVDEVLAKSPLMTDAAKQAFEQAYSHHDAELKKQFKTLPNDDAIKSYSDRLKALSKKDIASPADLKAAQKEFAQIKSEIKEEKQKVVSFKDSLATAKQDVSDKLADVKSAVDADYNKLKGLVAGDIDSLNEITQLLFGEQAKVWSERLFSAYNLIVPLLQSEKENAEQREREEGRWVNFSDESGLPDFLVRKAKVSVDWQGESFLSDWRNITTDHDVLGKATTFTVNSSSTSAWKLLNVKGNFWLSASGLKAHQQWDLQGLVLKQLPIQTEKLISGQLEEARMSSSGSLAINDSMLQGKSVIALADMVLAMQGDEGVGNNIATFLNKLSELKMDADIGGSLEDPDFSIGSNLDEQIRNSFVSGATGKGQKKLGELKQKLGARTGGLLDGEGSALDDWQQLEDIANGTSDSLNEMLKAKFDGALNKKKDKLKKDVLNKVFK